MKKLILLLSLFACGCTTLESISTSSIPAQRNRKVMASTDKFVILGFNFSNDYVDSIVRDLANQCPNGRIEGILTKQESINYFLYLFWTSKITAQGYCVQGNLALNKNPRQPAADDIGATSTHESEAGESHP